MYNEMIQNIKKNRPAESFYFSESSGETYVNSFDGLLTWMWNLYDLVPASVTDCNVYSQDSSVR